MEYIKFFDGMEKIYLTFGKKVPDKRILDITFDRISQLPDSFMDYVIKHFQDQTDLPKNMGYCLLRELWPNYLDDHHELRSCHETQCCPLCASELPGFRKVYKRDGSPEIVRCTCGNAPNPRNDPIYTNQQLVSWGYSLTPIYTYDPGNLPRKWLRGVGNNEEIRPEHARVLKEYEDYEF